MRFNWISPYSIIRLLCIAIGFELLIFKTKKKSLKMPLKIRACFKTRLSVRRTKYTQRPCVQNCFSIIIQTLLLVPTYHTFYL